MRPAEAEAKLTAGLLDLSSPAAYEPSVEIYAGTGHQDYQKGPFPGRSLRIKGQGVGLLQVISLGLPFARHVLCYYRGNRDHRIVVQPS